MPIIGDSSGTERPEALGKHVMSLPTLADYTPSNPTALGDWIAMIEPMLSSLTDTGRVWWHCVYSKAYQAYAKWLSVSPLERLGIKAELEGLKVVQTVHVLLEQRAVSLLLQAIPERLKTEIVSTRMLGSVMIFYKLLTAYQPGGANERSTMLNFLVQPSPATSISEAIKGVRQWAQWRSRLRELRAAEPDATLLIKGLDGLSSALLAKHPTVHFRVASFREKLGVDYSPTSETATKLAEMLQAEFELLLHSAGEQEVKQDSDAKKRARLNKAQKGTGDETEEGDKGKGKGKRYSRDGERPFCWIYGKTDAGCKFGSRCKFRHDKDSLERGRCFECGAVGHLQPQCPYKDGASSNVDSNPERSRSKGNSPKGGKGGKGAKWGNAKKAEVAEGGDETANAGLDKGSASPSSPSTANQVLVEALEVLKSMKLSSEQSASSGDPSVRMLCGSGLLQQEGRVALVDTAATHLARTLFPWECLPDTTVMVQSALGGVTMRITEKGTLIREDNGPLIIPLWLILEFGANLTVINGMCHVGAKSSLDPPPNHAPWEQACARALPISRPWLD